MTYGELEAKLQAWLEDDDAEFQGSIPDVIDLAQMRLWRDLDLSIFSAEETANTAVGNPVVTKPTTDTELVSWNSIYYPVAGGKNVYLELRSTDFVRDHQTAGTNAPPRYYAEQSETDIILSPLPDQIYVMNFRGTTRLTPLDSNTPSDTNWLSLHQSDLLFKACLAEAEAFLKSDDRKPIWFEDYTGALPLAKKETYNLMQARYQLTPLQVPASPTTQR
jgi:hypothetical protein